MHWPIVKFGTFLKLHRRPHTLASTEDANLVGMRLYGEGPFHRELKAALQIAKKSHFIIKAGDVIYNKLFAWKGTFGIVPPELDGMFVSDKFPTYEVDQKLVEPRFLKWYFRHPPLWDQALGMSTGSAALSKLTLNPPKYLLLQMPLPPLHEQRRIVDRIESVAAKLDEARRLKEESRKEINRIVFAACERAFTDAAGRFQSRPLQELVDQDRGISYGIVQTGTYVDDGIPTLRAGDLRWFAVNDVSRVKRVAPDIEAGYRRTRLRGGELLLRIRGGVGELAVAPPSLSGANVSREIAVIPLKDDVNPDFAMFLLAATSSQTRMTGHVKGTSYVGINLKDVRTLPLPIPPIAEQERIIVNLTHIREMITTLGAIHDRTTTEVSALLPAILSAAFAG